MANQESVSGIQTLSYLNQQEELKPISIVAKRDPNINDKRYPIGTEWINKKDNHVYKLTSAPVGMPNWEPVSQSAGGSAPVSKYIVDADGTGDYLTIQAAITAANAAGLPATVYVRPGTYTEDLTFYAGIEVVGAINIVDTGNLIIIGTHIPPAAGNISIGRATLQSATDIFNSAAAGTGTIYLFECSMNVTNGYTFNLPNWVGTLEANDIGDIGTDNGFVNNTGGATIFTNNGQVGAGTGNTLTANGDCRFDLTFVNCPVNISGGTMFHNFALFSQTLTISGTATGDIFLGDFFTGATPAIVMSSANNINLRNCIIDSSNSPSIDGAGAGVLSFAGMEFLDNSELAATLTLSSASRFATAGVKIVEGTNATMGIATLVAGTVTVNTTAVTANSRIQLTHQNNAGTPDFVSVTARVAGTSFTITSGNAADTSDIAWMIVEPA